jgi:CheY-like chemotaxis protein
MTERVTTPEAEREQAGRKHILGVNGHPPFLELLRGILQDEQYNVTTTNYVPHTFDLILALQPALVIVDLVIYQRAGWELLDRLHQEIGTCGIPLLLTSVEPQILARAQAAAAHYGEHRAFVHPFHLANLVQTVDDLIGKA